MAIYNKTELYFFKFPNTFFDKDEIELFEDDPEGDSVVILYLKLITLAMNTCIAPFLKFKLFLLYYSLTSLFFILLIIPLFFIKFIIPISIAEIPNETASIIIK